MAKTVYVPKWLMPFGEGLTLYKLVFIKKGLSEDVRAYVIAHEDCHVSQWKKAGLCLFPIYYLVELAKNGYYNNKYEIEAREYGKAMAFLYRDL